MVRGRLPLNHTWGDGWPTQPPSRGPTQLPRALAPEPGLGTWLANTAPKQGNPHNFPGHWHQSPVWGDGWPTQPPSRATHTTSIAAGSSALLGKMVGQHWPSSNIDLQATMIFKQHWISNTNGLATQPAQRQPKKGALSLEG